MRLIESILADAASIAAVRRDIHAHPELCFEEKRTSDLIAEQLTSWGIPIHRGMGTTGVVAILKNGSSERAVRRRMVGVTVDADGPAVLDGDEHRAGVGTIVWTGGADNGRDHLQTMA